MITEALVLEENFEGKWVILELPESLNLKDGDKIQIEVLTDGHD